MNGFDVAKPEYGRGIRPSSCPNDCAGDRGIELGSHCGRPSRWAVTTTTFISATHPQHFRPSAGNLALGPGGWAM